MFKKSIFFLLLFLFLCTGNIFAFKAETFITFSNPVRGAEGWQSPGQDPLELPKFQYLESTHSAFPVTWLLRFDAVTDATISAFFNDLIETDKNQFLGAFLEITPKLALSADVTYNPGFSIFNSNRIFLSGYNIYQRKSLIDAYMSAFFDRFGFYPKTVSAWHLDSYSLNYLQEKYSVVAAMNCDDQYSTDHYRLWGGYIGSPYFPDKNNSLVPAKNKSERVDLAMVRWAQRDFFNTYGSHLQSSYSVQVNDYTGLKQNTLYFERLLSQYSQKSFNEFTHINIGLENDYSLKLYKAEILKQYNVLRENKEKLNLRYISLADFGEWLKARYPESSPAYLYKFSDSRLTEEGHVYWYQSPFYRLSLSTKESDTKIIDFRVYNRDIYEEYHSTRNEDTNLYHEIPAVIDTVKYPDSAISIKVNLDDFEMKHSKILDNWQQTFIKGDQAIILEPEKIIFRGIEVAEPSSKDIKVARKGDTTTWYITPHTPFKNDSSPKLLFWILIALIAHTVYKKLGGPKKPKMRNFLIGIVISLIAGFVLFRNGLLYPFGMGFWGPNGHDAIFHLSVIESFSSNPFSFSHPQLAGEIIKNYHFLFDYISGIIVRLTGISSLDWYFRIFPIIGGIAIVWLLDQNLRKWNFSRQERLLAVLLAFLAGSLGFIPKLITGQDVFTGESAFWSNQSVSIFLNPPYALSIILLLAILVLLNSPKSPKQFMVLALLGGLLAQTKVYAFILLLGALLISKKYKLFTGVLIVGVLISLPFITQGGQSPFIFSPLWFPRSLFASFDRFYWPELVSAWQVYEASGSFIKLILINIFALSVFLVGNLGVRIFGLYEIYRSKLSSDSKKITAWIIFLGIIIPLVFVQTVNPWNTIQFIYYSLFFLAIFTARYLVRQQVWLAIPLLIIALFTSFGTLKDYQGYFSSSRISYTELRALETLRDQPRGIVLAPLFQDNESKTIASPKPLYAYVSNAYISALSAQPEFLSDTINLDITGFSYYDRAKKIQRFYNTTDKEWALDFLKENNISYVYENPLQRIKLAAEDLRLKKIFDSGEIKLYKFN